MSFVFIEVCIVVALLCWSSRILAPFRNGERKIGPRRKNLRNNEFEVILAPNVPIPKRTNQTPILQTQLLSTPIRLYAVL